MAGETARRARRHASCPPPGCVPHAFNLQTCTGISPTGCLCACATPRRVLHRFFDFCMAQRVTARAAQHPCPCLCEKFRPSLASGQGVGSRAWPPERDGMGSLEAGVNTPHDHPYRMRLQAPVVGMAPRQARAAWAPEHQRCPEEPCRVHLVYENATPGMDSDGSLCNLKGATRRGSFLRAQDAGASLEVESPHGAYERDGGGGEVGRRTRQELAI